MNLRDMDHWVKVAVFLLAVAGAAHVLWGEGSWVCLLPFPTTDPTTDATKGERGRLT